MIIEPLEFKGQVTRSLSSWCSAVPAIDVALNLLRGVGERNHRVGENSLTLVTSQKKHENFSNVMTM